jgi:glycolate oxidase iron-sulfur subunit
LGIIKANTLTEIKDLTDIYTQCIHCGMCLSVCPTYELTKLETSSPRGRIKLIKAVAEGGLSVTDNFAYEMNFCLDCQACETACPAGVKYGKMVEAARVEVDKHGYSSFIKSVFLKSIVPHKNRLKIAAKLLRFYQRSGLQKLVRATNILNLSFPKLAEAEEFSPSVPDKSSDTFIKEINYPAVPRKYTLAFSYGCLMNVLLPDVNKDTIELLNKIGAVVISPPGQTCCGSLNAHNGDIKTAKKLAAKNIKEFGKFEYEFLISNSAGCGAFMKEYGELFKDDKEMTVPAKKFSSKVKDLTEFLWETNLPSLKHSLNQSFTYHDACHLVHTQKIYNQPRELFNKFKEINYIPLEDSTKCCGSAGIYNLIHSNTSNQLIKMKVENIEKTKADVVLTENPGCMLQLAYGFKRLNKNIKVEHPATFFNKRI